MKAVLLFAGALLTQAVHAQSSITVGAPAWDGLSDQEKALIQAKYVVDRRPLGGYGLVLDNQGVNESTSGTNAGVALGGTLAQTIYIDRAIRGGNYSATGQLAAGILGAVIGSAADRPAVQQFHFRYALKLPNGDIQSFDSVQSDAFRHPAGMCLSIPDLRPISQSVCTHTTADLRRLHLAAAPSAPTPSPPTPSTTGGNLAPPIAGDSARVECKIGNQAPFVTTLEKCLIIGGKLL